MSGIIMRPWVYIGDRIVDACSLNRPN